MLVLVLALSQNFEFLIQPYLAIVNSECWNLYKKKKESSGNSLRACQPAFFYPKQVYIQNHWWIRKLELWVSVRRKWIKVFHKCSMEQFFLTTIKKYISMVRSWQMILSFEVFFFCSWTTRAKHPSFSAFATKNLWRNFSRWKNTT